MALFPKLIVKILLPSAAHTPSLAVHRGGRGSSPGSRHRELFFLFFLAGAQNERKDFPPGKANKQRTDHNTIPPNCNIGNVGLCVGVLRNFERCIPNKPNSGNVEAYGKPIAMPQSCQNFD
jgi:hypothetical protein